MPSIWLFGVLAPAVMVLVAALVFRNAVWGYPVGIVAGLMWVRSN